MNEQIERQKEELHLTNTINCLNKEISANEEFIAGNKKTLKLLQEYMRNNPNLDPKEIAGVLMENEQSVDTALEYMKKKELLERIKNSPYFSCIRFKQDGDDEFTNFYYGIKGLWDKDGIYIVDWRTPCGALYYDGNVGRAKYKAPQGIIEGEIEYKRQLKVENGKLKYFFDSNIKIDDDILQEALSKNSSNTMTNIVQTIQKEQNEVIRDDLKHNIVLNGVAGSGKTSIGMHRIAYLLYANKDILNKDNILIISPNELFTKYISTVLPELGEDNVRTSDLATILMAHLPTFSTIVPRNELVEDVLSGNSARLLEAERKYAYSHYENLCEFLKQKNDPEKLDRLKLLGKYINPLLVKENYYEPYSFNLYKSCEITATRLVSIVACEKSSKQQENLKEALCEQMVKKLVGEDINNLIKEFYILKGFNTANLTYEKIRSEDLATFAFLNIYTKGLNTDYSYKQIFIDELQDYDNTTLMLLKAIYPKTYFTMVGDYNQNLLFNTTNKQSAISFDSSKYYELINSYRSTSNITDFSASILNKKFNSTFVRRGEEVKLYKCKNFEEKLSKIKDQIEEYEKAGHKRIAIVCKNNEECEMYKGLLNGFECVTSELQDVININKVVVSVLLSKGLEFDAVIVPDVSDNNYGLETDKQVLYVASTRALHKLSLFTSSNISKFIGFNSNVEIKE